MGFGIASLVSKDLRFSTLKVAKFYSKMFLKKPEYNLQKKEGS